MTDYVGTAGNDHLVGSDYDDHFYIDQGGSDTMVGGAGRDTIDAGTRLTAGDRIDGGDGTDLLILNGDYGAGLVLGDDVIRNIEALQLNGGHAYNLTLGALTLSTDARNFSIGASGASSLAVDASAAGVAVDITGSQGNDH